MLCSQLVALHGQGMDFLRRAMLPEQTRLLDEARKKPATEEELQEQRISFAFGNAPFRSELITKESVRQASKRISLMC
jgi:hypothetical protein